MSWGTFLIDTRIIKINQLHDAKSPKLLQLQIRLIPSRLYSRYILAIFYFLGHDDVTKPSKYRYGSNMEINLLARGLFWRGFFSIFGPYTYFLFLSVVRLDACFNSAISSMTHVLFELWRATRQKCVPSGIPAVPQGSHIWLIIRQGQTILRKYGIEI